MDADDHTVEVVLKEARRFMVPIYQRKYQWGDKRLIPFWEDVSAKAAEVLDGSSKFEHYMGALILSPVGNGSQIGITPVVQVVDGQQRLTTFQIFLSALREVARRHNQSDFIKHVNGYLMNEPKSKDTDELTRFKLTPTLSDRKLIHDIIEMTAEDVDKEYKHFYYGGRVPKSKPHRAAFRAYYLFRKWIEEFIVHGPQDFEEPLEDEQGQPEATEQAPPGEQEDTGTRLEALLKALLDRMKLVVITLGPSDDAQVIFETLNSKGEPLLAMDLVKNNIFHRAEKQKASIEELFKKLWDPLDDKWWREPAPNARPVRPRIDHFLAHVLVAESGQKISMRELYAEYRNFAVPKGTPRFENVEDELKLLEHYTPIYRTLEGVESYDSPALSWLGRKLSTWQITTAYPVALQMGDEQLDEGQRQQVAELIYSYIVRRAICDLTMKNMNNIFQSLAAHFIAEGVSVSSFYSFFSVRKSNSVKFPTDKEFQTAILSGNAYSIAPQPRLVDILWELELSTKSKLSESIEQPSGLWVEHVLPQKWTDEWPFEDGSTSSRHSEEAPALTRNAMIHVMGNLTLLTDYLNKSVGNGSFAEKKQKFAKHTGLFLNKWFADKERWTEHEIRIRGEHLANLALIRWKGLNE